MPAKNPRRWSASPALPCASRPTPQARLSRSKLCEPKPQVKRFIRWATKTAEWSEKDEEAFFALTDAERAGAADGTFFKQQYDVMKAEEEEIEREIREREEAGKELPPLVLQVPKPRSPNNVYAGAGHRVLADPVERVSPRSNLRGSVSLPALQTRS